MKIFIVLATTLLAVSALSVEEHWHLFKVKHGKSYENSDEEKLRFQVFQDNVQKINAHNARYEAGLETYTMAVNKFADLTRQEFGAMHGLKKSPIKREHLYRHVQYLKAPESIDWREKGAVLDVKNQLECGSCWAHSTTGVIEGQNAIKNNIRIPLSEQQLVDCQLRLNGCGGGDIPIAMDYIIRYGLNSEAEYPYEAKDGRCRAHRGSFVNVTKVVTVDPTESALKEAVGTVGPISVGIDYELIQFYESGIFDNPDCSNDADDLNHAVLAVGYGIENGKKFWIIKNSYGSDWGDKGYFKLVRDAGQCGIALETYYPILA